MARHVSAARMAAFRLLLGVARSRGAHADELLRGPAIDALSVPDRNLATALVMGVLRWQLALDALLEPYLHRRVRLDEEVAIALRLGAWQLLGMDRIPPHAALAESVELAKAAGFEFAAGMVNAVLRRIAEARGTLEMDPAAAHPAWLMTRWRRHFGAKAANAVAVYDQQEPGPSLRLSSATESLPPGAFLRRARRPAADAVPAGTWLQDEGSQLVAEIAGRGRRILDCCAAPGGKTTILAEDNPRAEITAVDVSQRRLDAMRRSFQRDARTLEIHCVQADATALPFRDDFDCILCDAPCSGTGTLARNPEIRLRLIAEELGRQQVRQLAILRSAFAVLATGGRLTYSTCSLEPEENADVVEAFLRTEPAARVLEMGARLEEMRREGALHPEGIALLKEQALRGPYLQTLPGTVPCDGFFVALLTRV